MPKFEVVEYEHMTRRRVYVVETPEDEGDEFGYVGMDIAREIAESMSPEEKGDYLEDEVHECDYEITEVLEDA